MRLSYPGRLGNNMLSVAGRMGDVGAGVVIASAVTMPRLEELWWVLGVASSSGTCHENMATR